MYNISSIALPTTQNVTAYLKRTGLVQCFFPVSENRWDVLAIRGGYKSFFERGGWAGRERLGGGWDPPMELAEGLRFLKAHNPGL